METDEMKVIFTSGILPCIVYPFYKEGKRNVQHRRAFIAVKPYYEHNFCNLHISGQWRCIVTISVIGLPFNPAFTVPAKTSAVPVGFPMWLNLAHWVNFFFLILIIRSALCYIAGKMDKLN